MRRAALVMLLAMLLPAAIRAQEESLTEFLRSAEEAMRLAVAVRGDGELQVVTPERTVEQPLVVILRPPHEMYLNVQPPGMKALLLGAAAYRLPPGGTAAQQFAGGASFAGSDFTCEDLQPFQRADYKDARISDESDTELTVTLFPRSGAYSQVVITFDRERRVPLKMLYYHETLNNAVKMRRDDDLVLIGRKWLPTRITMEAFKLHTSSTMHLRWSQDPQFPPELFDPAFLARSMPQAEPLPSVTPSPK